MLATYPKDAPGEVSWFDLLDPTPEEAERVREATGLRVPTKHEVSEIESTSRLGFEKGTYYLSAPLATRVGDGQLDLVPVGFVLGARVLVTVRYDAVGAIDEARSSCEKQRDVTAETAFLRILETVVDRSADGLEHAGAECDGLSRAAFRERAAKGESLRGELRRIGAIANKT